MVDDIADYLKIAASLVILFHSAFPVLPFYRNANLKDGIG
jgi:hypothetical protein